MEMTLDLDLSFFQFVPHQTQGDIDQPVQILWGKAQLPGGAELEEISSDAIGSSDGLAHLLQDHGCVFVGLAEPFGEKVQSHHHDGEGILDFMSHTGSERPNRFHFLGLNELRLGRLQLRVGLA